MKLSVTFFNSFLQTAKQSVAANPDQMDQNGCDIWTQRPPKPRVKPKSVTKFKSPKILYTDEKQYKKENRRCIKAVEALCTLWLPLKTQNHATKYFTKNEKNKSFPVMICHQQYVGQIVMITTTKRP